MSPQKDTLGPKGGATGAPRTTDPEFSEFLLRACHDLRSALRSVRAHAELNLKRGDTAPEAGLEESLGFIVNGARKIDRLVEGIASYSIALRTTPESFQPTAMDVALRTVLAKLAAELRDNRAKVSYDKLPRVKGDPDRLIDVLEQLLSNALRHRGEAPPEIHIAAERRETSWVFSVRDNGPGVEGAYLSSIFKPFERLTGGDSAGPGLGLAIGRAIVERHGGRIWAESDPGAGCTFLFELPAE